MSRLKRATGLTAALGLLLLQTGCASLPFGGPEKFDAASQAKLIRQQQVKRAAADANTAALKPIALEDRLHQGDVLRGSGDYAGAMWHYLQAHEQSPQDPAPITRMASLHLLSDPRQAESMFRKLVGEQDRDPAVFNNLGLALGRLGRYDEALDAFRRGGAEQAARNNLGFMHYLNGSYDRAIEEYERALLVDGDQRLLVLRNLRAAKRAKQERHASAKGAPAKGYPRSE